MNENDQKIQELLDLVTKQKKALQKPSSDYETNMAFPWKNSFTINLTTVTTMIEVVGIIGYLLSEKDYHDKACTLLDIKIPFKHGNFTFDDWLDDLKSIAHKISYKEKKNILAQTEARLNTLISKEMKDMIELDALSKIVNGWKNN